MYIEKLLLNGYTIPKREFSDYRAGFSCRSAAGIRRNSASTNSSVTTKAARSAVGAAYIMPSSPQIRGSATSSGIRKITCRVIERNSPFSGLPMAAKKLEERSCTPFITTISRKIRIDRTPKR